MNGTSVYQLTSSFFAGVLDLLYPPHCLLCKTLGEDFICPACLASLIVPVPQPYCIRCGQVQSGAECSACTDYPDTLIRCRAVGIYDGKLAEALHLLKYRDRPMLAQPLAGLMENYLRIRAEIMNDLRFDAIIPVPLHKARKKKRGYNQSELLSKELGRLLGIPTDTSTLIRTRNTKPQVGKHRGARLINLDDAFKADPQRCSGKTFLLLDDVSTTGSTLCECAKALTIAGAKNIYAITMAAG